MGVLFSDEAEERSGHIPQSEGLHEIRSSTKLSTDEAGKNGWYEGCDLVRLVSRHILPMRGSTHVRVHVK